MSAITNAAGRPKWAFCCGKVYLMMTDCPCVVTVWDTGSAERHGPWKWSINTKTMAGEAHCFTRKAAKKHVAELHAAYCKVVPE